MKKEQSKRLSSQKKETRKQEELTNIKNTSIRVRAPAYDRVRADQTRRVPRVAKRRRGRRNGAEEALEVDEGNVGTVGGARGSEVGEYARLEEIGLGVGGVHLR